MNCKCGELAEVKWTVNGPKEVRQEHVLCVNCMSHIWEQVNKNYNSSYAQQCSSFEYITY